MLEVRDIAFAYSRRSLLNGVSFSVASGEMVALVGANGAGKSTLMRILAALLQPSAGTVLADRTDIFRAPLKYRRILGYLPELAPVEPGFTVKGYLKFRSQLKGEQSRKIRHRVSEALEACALENIAEEPVGRLSQGQRRRLALADAILLRPRFIVADDIFAGVDPAAREDLARSLGGFLQFASVICSGHELEALGRLTQRFLVLREGRIKEVKGAAAARAEITA